MKAVEPCRRNGPNSRFGIPQLFGAFDLFQVSASNFGGGRLQHLTAAECVFRRGIADDERLPPHRRHWFFKEKLGEKKEELKGKARERLQQELKGLFGK